MVIIASKPGIRVQIQMKGDSLTRVTLFSAPMFSLDTELCRPDYSKKTLERFTSWLKAYSQRKFTPFPLPLPAEGFQGDVLRFLQSIPWGSVVSYKDVAKAVGNPRAARAIGNICRGNLFPLLIPCHRVVRSDGKMGEYTPDPALKYELLQFEGVLHL